MPAARGYTVLIDGYNVLHRRPEWARLPLEDGRRRVIAWVSQMRWTIPVRRVIVVFDGTLAGGITRADVGGIEVRFATPSADAWIQETIRTQAAVAPLLVVSDDREILGTAKSHGAQRRRSVELFAKRRRRPICDEADVEKITGAAARAITDELIRRWCPSENGGADRPLRGDLL